MQPITAIKATYCSNYNGAYLIAVGAEDDLSSHDDPEVRKTADKCVEAIVDTLVDECDDDGEYQGTKSNMIDVMTKEVKKYFGEHVEVVVEEDSVSS